MIHFHRHHSHLHHNHYKWCKQQETLIRHWSGNVVALHTGDVCFDCRPESKVIFTKVTRSFTQFFQENSKTTTRLATATSIKILFHSSSYYSSTLYSRGGQTDDLREPNFSRQRGRDPCLSKIKHCFPYVITRYFCSSNYSRLDLRPSDTLGSPRIMYGVLGQLTPLKVGPTGRPAPSVTTNLRSIISQRRSQLHRGGSQNSRTH